MVNLSDIPLDNIDPNQSFDPLPPSKYAMRVTATESKPTKAGDGAYMQVELEIDENHHPEHKGRKVWDRLNLWNKNTTAAEIAQRQLKALVLACGLHSVADSSELHGHTVLVKIKVRPANAGYDATNEVAGYEPISGSQQAPRPAVTSGGSRAAAAPAAAGKPAWARK